MRLLLPLPPGQEADRRLGVTALRELYAFPDRPTWRALMVSTLDGSAAGADQLSGSLGTAGDARIFTVQRSLADTVIVGAGTVRAEQYTRLSPERGQRVAPLLVVVSRSGSLPPGVVPHSGRQGEVVLAVAASAPIQARRHAQRVLGKDAVWELGEGGIDHQALRERLTSLGHHRVLCEGGPTLLGSMYAAGVVDELSLTWVPQVVAGAGPRITHGPDLALSLRPRLLLEDRGTLLGLWQVSD